MRNVKQWRVSVEAVTESREIAGREWKVIGQNEMGKEQYGYTPEIEKMVERRETVLDQRMDELDLRALVAVMNGLQARDVAIVAGGVDLTKQAAKEMVLDAFGWSRNVRTGAWNRVVAGRVVPGLSAEWVENRHLQALCCRLADLEQVATGPHHPDDTAESGPGGTKEGPIERSKSVPEPSEVLARVRGLTRAGYKFDVESDCHVHPTARRIISALAVGTLDTETFVATIAGATTFHSNEWRVFSVHPIAEPIINAIKARYGTQYATPEPCDP